ncbi:histidine phosphatase family protein [Gordonia lacunae]|uniref:Phosphoglycerate mutase n=1 Tax=Gordonia lacunae TaxID=417102 RepID=A0A243QEX5_9ACTN|nr:histidine phosphatase family protein [Gordonia lacunae]OUC80283.1 phosphoglycerate mutase [Gordonia lacunae]
MTVELLMIRHARPHRVTHDPVGADPGLTDEGVVQAHTLADRLAGEPYGEITRIVSSSMRRARETAEPLATALGVTLEIEDRIVEVDSGWKNYGTAIASYPSRRAGWADLNSGSFGGNTFDISAFRARVLAGFDHIIKTSTPGSTVAVVCHGGVISTYLSHVLGTAKSFFVDVAYTSVSRIIAEADCYRELVSVNETSHLERSHSS